MALPQSHNADNLKEEASKASLSSVRNTDNTKAKIKILVIQQKMIGDVLASTIICEALRKKYPFSNISYLVNSNTKPVVIGNPHIDTIIEFKPEFKESKTAFFKFLKHIRGQRYDLVIDAYGKLESNLISLFSGADEKISYYKWYTSFLYNETIKPSAKALTNAGLALENRLRLIYPEYVIASKIIRPKIYVTEEEKLEAKNFLSQNGIDLNKPIIMIGVLGSEKIKTLPAAYMAKIIDQIAVITEGSILFNYIPNQLEEAQEIYDKTAADTKEQIHFDVYAKGLRSFIAVLSQCDLLVGNEGGAVNMAKALDIPTFTFFSPWIIKSAWNMFEDGTQHDSVHLNDFKPQLFENKSIKELKEQALDLYKEFSPELYKEKLNAFLQKFNTRFSLSQRESE
ncbi:glycosyltransferase family 9 protein [Aquimarina brevivitae]|uniref:Heptosyltransferase-2 n=1 Tax=Aquimarina brevivitae TaxID=323412 RepID=A0A4V2F7M6_9FLAO|nr:glycosyltransferase family 9 protein [Aquimarina brevivitae]RZT00350.1 heptosyltransferase-2 [Aquimarina brevivitae]